MAARLLPLELIDKCIGSKLWIIMKGEKVGSNLTVALPHLCYAIVVVCSAMSKGRQGVSGDGRARTVPRRSDTAADLTGLSVLVSGLVFAALLSPWEQGVVDRCSAQVKQVDGALRTKQATPPRHLAHPRSLLTRTI